MEYLQGLFFVAGMLCFAPVFMFPFVLGIAHSEDRRVLVCLAVLGCVLFFFAFAMSRFSRATKG